MKNVFLINKLLQSKAGIRAFFLLTGIFIFSGKVYALNINQMLADGYDFNLHCPSGYIEDSERSATPINEGRFSLNLRCVRQDIGNYNAVTRKIVAGLNDYYYVQNNPIPSTATEIQNQWNYLQSDPYSPYYVSTSELIYLRNMGVDQVNPGPNADAYVVDMAGRLGERTPDGYREFVGNSVHPVCESGYTQGSFYTETASTWNTQPGDALVTRNIEFPIFTLFQATGIVFTHAGMATGRYGVRHNTGYQDYISDENNIIQNEDMLGALERYEWLAKVNPEGLYESPPGTLTENISGTLCKADPVNGDPCDPDNLEAENHRREFLPGMTYVLTSTDPVNRQYFNSALEWAIGTDQTYSVYGFSQGAYNSGNNVCSTFVRDALINAYGETTFNTLYTATPDLADVDYLLGGNYSQSWDLNNYSPVSKTFFYSAKTRSIGANTLYKSIFDSAADQVNSSVQDTVNGDGFLKFINDVVIFFAGSSNAPEVPTEVISKQIRKDIATQMVNCFAFNECDNPYPRSTVYDPDLSYSRSGRMPYWSESDITFNRPAEEGWAFSADELFYFSAYDKLVQLIEIPGQTLNSCSLDVNGNCDPASTTFRNQWNQDDVSLFSCASDGTHCECDMGQTCSCSQNSSPYVEMHNYIHKGTRGLQVTYDNDRLDGNSRSIAGLMHGLYTHSYTVDFDQSVTFIPYHDRRDYPNLAPDRTLSPVSLVQTTRDIDGNKINPVTTFAYKGDKILIAMYVEYGFDTKLTWKIIKNGVQIKFLQYTLPHTSENPITSLYRSFAMRYTVWNY